MINELQEHRSRIHLALFRVVEADWGFVAMPPSRGSPQQYPNKRQMEDRNAKQKAEKLRKHGKLNNRKSDRATANQEEEARILGRFPNCATKPLERTTDRASKRASVQDADALLRRFPRCLSACDLGQATVFFWRDGGHVADSRTPDYTPLGKPQNRTLTRHVDVPRLTHIIIISIERVLQSEGNLLLPLEEVGWI